MRFLVVICVITALAAPSLGQSSSSAAPEFATTEDNPAAPEAQSEDKANADAAPASRPAENPPIEAESSDANNQAPETIPNIAKPLVDPTPAPGEEHIAVELPHKTRPFYDFFHSLYDRLPFHLSDLPSLWPFRRTYPGRGRFPPRARYPDRYVDRYPERDPGAFIVRESEPDYY